MKVLIAGSGEGYQNYKSACEQMGIDCELKLEDIDPSAYDALLLPGGADIDPARYGEENKGSVGIDEHLDEYQFAILDAFYKAGKTVFGTCRGCQLLNVYFGGTLLQDIKGHRIENDGLHPAEIMEDGFLFGLYGKDAMVNSTHHQCVDKLGKDLKIAAVSEDGIPEAFYHVSRPVFAVQWHPERIMDKGGELIYRYFIDVAAGRSEEV